MSGPIVRKYGFPNFEKIFGERPIQHGAEEPAPAEGQATAGQPGVAAKPGTPTVPKPRDGEGE